MSGHDVAPSLDRAFEWMRQASLRCAASERVPRRTSAATFAAASTIPGSGLLAGLGWALRGSMRTASVAMARTTMRRIEHEAGSLGSRTCHYRRRRRYARRVAVATLQGPQGPAETLGTTGFAAPLRAPSVPHGSDRSADATPAATRSRAARSPHTRCQARLHTRNSPACLCRAGLYCYLYGGTRVRVAGIVATARDRPDIVDCVDASRRAGRTCRRRCGALCGKLRPTGDRRLHGRCSRCSPPRCAGAASCTSSPNSC